MKHLFLVAASLFLTQFAHALEVGDQAPCVELSQIAVDGSESEHCIRDPKTKGQAVVQEFFSVTCSDCLDSFAPMNQVAEELGAKSTFRLISVDRNEQQVRSFISENRGLITHELAFDSARSATKVYGVIETPTIFILNPQNKVIYKHEGLVTADTANEIKAAVLTVSP